MDINDYFDKIYLLNLNRKPQRLESSISRLNEVGIDFEKYGATDGSVMNHIWNKLGNNYFSNPNYLACSISHLSIYNDAISKGYTKILILEDDVKVNLNCQSLFNQISNQIPVDWELLYFGYIPLTDDCSYWSYNIFNDRYLSQNIWGLFSYAISENLMKEMVDIYNTSFPMEIDRYYVNNIQQRGKSYGISPQLFCVDNIHSDNLNRQDLNMIEKSVDIRYAKYEDYI